jgi:histidinol dehydrogenase
MPGIPTYHTTDDDVPQIIRQLHSRLSVRGDVVSEAGRQKTIEVFGAPLSPAEVVSQICGDVKQEGVAAVLRYTAALDGAHLTADELRVPAAELAAAHARADKAFLATVRRIRDSILAFQERLLPENVEVTTLTGARLEQRFWPLRRVGLCVPGGAAAYPSTVLMTAVPAQAAGVEQLAVVAPPTDFGAHNDDVLATCQELGIREVYRMGGAQAVAALAYGIDGVPQVDKIVGPGNLFVALAKRHVFGEVDIDSIAGPSEVVVIADQTTNPQFAAADLLAQAEHAPGVCILISWDEATMTQTLLAMDDQLQRLDRADVTRQSLADFAMCIVARDEAEACQLTNQLAPEHLHIAVADARRLSATITTAGATFLGHFSPVALGDYVAGPSHVLPTGGTARWASGLSATSFLRSGSVIEFPQTALDAVADDVQMIATKEQLTAHWESVRLRRSDSS